MRKKDKRLPSGVGNMQKCEEVIKEYPGIDFWKFWTMGYFLIFQNR